MNKLERFQAAVAGRHVDRQPFVMWLHFVTNYLNGAEAAHLHARFFRRADTDIAKAISDYRWTLPEGMETFETPADMERIGTSPMTDPNFVEQLRLLRVLRADLGDEWPLMDTSFDPVQQITRRVGLAKTQMIYDNPRQSRPMLEAVTETVIRYVRELKKQGVDSVLYSVHGSIAPPHPKGIDDATFREFHRPYDIAILEEMQGMTRVLHTCQHHLDLDRIRDYPFEVLSWYDRHPANPTLAEARRRFPRACLMGGFDHTAVIGRTPPDLRAEIVDAVDQLGGCGLILSPGCTIPSQIPFHLIDTIHDTLERIGPGVPRTVAAG